MAKISYTSGVLSSRSMVTVSPTRLPRMALPTGDRRESRPSEGLASCGPTIW